MTNSLTAMLSGGDLRSDGQANEVVALVLENPELFDDLYAGLSDPDDLVRGRSADALEKVCRTRPDLLAVHVADLLEKAQSDAVAMVRWHAAMILGYLSIYPLLVGRITNTLLAMINDPAVFVQSWAIVGLVLIARLYPGREPEISEAIAPLLESSSTAIHSKAQKALTALSDAERPLPNGWVKSEQLQARV